MQTNRIEKITENAVPAIEEESTAGLFSNAKFPSPLLTRNQKAVGSIHLRRSKSCRPFFYFKGTLAEARDIAERELSIVFRRSGFPLTAWEARSLKEKVLGIAKEALEKGKPSTQILVVIRSNESLALKLSLVSRQRILVHSAHIIHGIYRWDSFGALESILLTGFRHRNRWTNTNAFFTNDRRIRGVCFASQGERFPETFGDRYSLEFVSPVITGATHRRHEYQSHSALMTGVSSKPLQNIARVNVLFYPLLSREEVAERKTFYRERLLPFDVPVAFVSEEPEFINTPAWQEFQLIRESFPLYPSYPATSAQK